MNLCSHLCSFHIQNFSLEGLPFYLGVAIYCYEVCIQAQGLIQDIFLGGGGGGGRGGRECRYVRNVHACVGAPARYSGNI